jgi:hypothetical protein
LRRPQLIGKVLGAYKKISTEDNQMKLTCNIDESQRKAASVAGFSFLFSIVIMIFPFYAISLRLIVPGNAVETAQNIIAHETLFRINIACYLINVINMIVLLTALYMILNPVNRTLALIALFCRKIYALMWCITVLNMLVALRFLRDDAFLSAFKIEQLQTLARLQLGIDAYYVGLPFWGLASLICCYLWFKSRYISRVLAGFGVIASTWAVICSFAYLIFPNFKNTIDADLFDFPLFIFEIALGFWLLFKGLNPSKLTESDMTSNQERASA